MESRAYALITGVFLLTMVAALLLAGWWLTGGGHDRVPYLLVSEQSVAGLRPYARIQYRGVDVGQVANIEFAGDGSGEIHAILEIERATPVTEHTEASLQSQGLMGQRVVSLDDTEPGGERLHSSDSDPARIPLRSDAANLEQVVAETAERITELTDQVSLFLDEDNRKAIAGTLENLEQITAMGPGVLAEMEKTLPEIRQTLPDMRETLAEMRETLAESRQTLGGANRALAEIEHLGQIGAHTTLPRLEQLLEEWESLARRLGDDPSAILFAPPPHPGPGEPGYHPPQE